MLDLRQLPAHTQISQSAECTEPTNIFQEGIKKEPKQQAGKSVRRDMQAHPQSVMVMGLLVLPLPLPKLSTFLTTSMPLVTDPNTTCLPSSQAVCNPTRKHQRQNNMKVYVRWMAEGYNMVHDQKELPAYLCSAQEELRAVGAGSGVCHGQDSCTPHASLAHLAIQAQLKPYGCKVRTA